MILGNAYICDFVNDPKVIEPDERFVNVSPERRTVSQHDSLVFREKYLAVDVEFLGTESGRKLNKSFLKQLAK